MDQSQNVLNELLYSIMRQCIEHNRSHIPQLARQCILILAKKTLSETTKYQLIQRLSKEKNLDNKSVA